MTGDDFFGRADELAVLEARVRGHNHVLLSGQRRMGKTSVLRELGRRLEADGWIALFVDVEGATSPEDAIADIAEATCPHRPLASRFAGGMGRWFTDRVEEIGASRFRLKVRAGLDAGSWRRYGDRLLGDCAAQHRPVLLLIDEVPILLKRMLRRDGDPGRVDAFLGWLRSAVHRLGDESPVVILSGSIGLEPLVRRLGIPDRVNYLDPFRLGPWGRETSAACIGRLAASHDLRLDGNVGALVHESLGVGIPHHVQCFFARLREHAIMRRRDVLAPGDVAEVYRDRLLGPAGQNDLVHYETRLRDTLDDEHDYSLAMESLAEAAVAGCFSAPAREALGVLYGELVEAAPARIDQVLEVLTHDGYLEATANGHRFASHLLADWWAARFRGRHVPLDERPDKGWRR